MYQVKPTGDGVGQNAVLEKVQTECVLSVFNTWSPGGLNSSKALEESLGILALPTCQQAAVAQLTGSVSFVGV